MTLIVALTPPIGCRTQVTLRDLTQRLGNLDVDWRSGFGAQTPAHHAHTRDPLGFALLIRHGNRVPRHESWKALQRSLTAEDGKMSVNASEGKPRFESVLMSLGGVVNG